MAFNFTRIQPITEERQTAFFDGETHLWKSDNPNLQHLLNAMQKWFWNSDYLDGEADIEGLAGINQFYKDNLEGFVSIEYAEGEDYAEELEVQ